MPDSLIEQVKRLAEAASAADAANRTKEQHRNACVKYASACAQVNFPALQPKEPTVGQRQSKQQEGIEAAQRIIEIIDDKEDLNQPALFRPAIRAHAVVALDGPRDKTS